jgi:hypothetical protein
MGVDFHEVPSVFRSSRAKQKTTEDSQSQVISPAAALEQQFSLNAIRYDRCGCWP